MKPADFALKLHLGHNKESKENKNVQVYQNKTRGLMDKKKPLVFFHPLEN